MYQVINNILNKIFGVKIIRIPKQRFERIKAQNQNAPLYIEFTGFSGVGKTTLFEKALEICGNQRTWFTPKEFIYQGGYSEENSLYNEEYQTIIISKIKSVLSRGYKLSDEINLVLHFLRNMQEEVLINRHNKEYTVVFDEGMYSNFGSEIRSLLQSEPEKYKHLLNNRAFIECTNTPENIAKQILKREKASGIIHPNYKVKTIDELIEIQKKSLHDRKQFLDLLKGYHSPILSINTLHSLEENAKKVNAFIEKQQKIR